MGSQMFGGWTESARQPVENARHAIGEAGDMARHAYDQMDDVITPYRQSLEDAVVSNPVKAIGVSLAVGVLLGWLIKRS